MPDPVDPTPNLSDIAEQGFQQNAGEFGAALRTTPNTPPASVAQPATDTPASPPRVCAVAEGPRYSPGGEVPIHHSGNDKYAVFYMSSRFDNNPAAGHDPACCEARQYIRWDDAYHASNGGPPHSGFSSNAAAGTYHEDTERTGTCHYGHRDENCDGDGNNRYTTGGKPDQANGDTFRAWDRPQVTNDRHGSFEFQLRIVDTCNASAVRGISAPLRVQW